MVTHIYREVDSPMLLVLLELALKVESFEDKQMNSMVLLSTSRQIASRQDSNDTCRQLLSLGNRFASAFLVV